MKCKHCGQVLYVDSGSAAGFNTRHDNAQGVRTYSYTCPSNNNLRHEPIERRPDCPDRDGCIAIHNGLSDSHPGYRHAESWEEVERAVRTGIAFDQDGDQPTHYMPGTDGETRIYWRRDGEVADSDYTLDDGDFGYILIPDVEPVTEDEEAATLASIIQGVRASTPESLFGPVGTPKSEFEPGHGRVDLDMIHQAIQALDRGDSNWEVREMLAHYVNRRPDDRK